MNSQDQNTRFQKYDFTPKRSQIKRKRRPHIWPWILGLIIVVLILTFGIRYALNNSNQVTNNATKSPTTAKNTATSNPSSHKTSKSTPTATKTATPVNQPAKAETQTTTPDSDSGFGETHTFNSIQDAKDWANATKPDWTAAGYNYWTVNQNSQGYYVLTFTK